MSKAFTVCEESTRHEHEHTKLREDIFNSMLSDDEFFLTADLFKMFGDSTRLKILYVLLEGEVCVCDIAKLINMTQSAVSHQLRVLKSSKLIKYRKSGKTVYYSLADAHVKTILSQGIEHIKE